MRIPTLYYVIDEKPGKSILSETENSEVQEFRHTDTEVENILMCFISLRKCVSLLTYLIKSVYCPF